MRILFILFFSAASLSAQTATNITSYVEEGRVVITYDLPNGKYDVSITASSAEGVTVTPDRIAGDIGAVAGGRGKSIWWEPQLEGRSAQGWKISLTAERSIFKWIFVDGGGKMNSFYIGAVEVTFDQYDNFCEETGAQKPSDQGWGRGNRPVINVSWDDAQEFCKWASRKTGKTIRLPKEKEWEFAARGGLKSRGTEYSGSGNLDEVGWYDGNSGSKTHEVAAKKPNELGIYDMSGNVWEWCEDWYTEGRGRVVRGGSWYRYDYYCRVGYRSSSYPADRYDGYGFRVLRTQN